MIALSNVTSLLTSSAGSAETLAIWQETVRTVNVEQTGAMDPKGPPLIVPLLDVLAVVMQLIVSTRYVC